MNAKQLIARYIDEWGLGAYGRTPEQIADGIIGALGESGIVLVRAVDIELLEAKFAEAELVAQTFSKTLAQTDDAVKQLKHDRTRRNG